MYPAQVFTPIGRNSLAEDVLKRLASSIREKAFGQDDYLPAERELARQLGVSRVVVREATKRLEQQGLVSIQQGVGVRVTNNPSLPVTRTICQILPDEKERLRQSALARLVVEPELAALAAINRTPSGLLQLSQRCERILSCQNIAGSVSEDMIFHEEIAALAGNQVLELMLKSIAETGRQSREITISRVGVQKAYDHHRAILAAIESGNPNDARSAMRHHLEAVLTDLS